MRLILLASMLLLFESPIVVAQQKYDVAGFITFCYESELQTIVLNNPVQVMLTSASGKTYATTINAAGNYSFSQIPQGNYSLSAAALGAPENDTTIQVTADITKLSFCIDKAYRPAPEDSIVIYQNKALKDIAAGNARIYEWTALSLNSDPFENLNPKVKKKYGFIYEMISCARPTTRQEIVQLKLWQAYNQVIYKHIDENHGTTWRKTIKHERAKLKGNNNAAWLF